MSLSARQEVREPRDPCDRWWAQVLATRRPHNILCVGGPIHGTSIPNHGSAIVVREARAPNGNINLDIADRYLLRSFKDFDGRYHTVYLLEDPWLGDVLDALRMLRNQDS